MSNGNDNSITFMRVLLGLLFLIPGISKLMNPDMIIGMLGGLGFPSAALFGWILILSEIVFGIALVVGFKVKYAVWPLIIILAVAILTVHIKDVENPMRMIDILFRLGAIAGLNLLRYTGNGSFAVSKE
ncbi:DoxX family protein [Candidatus Woesearchaeota archaeon]|mgnify:FL=1|jgi:putative oxidoreductase|nr:DoxX family protein [Candidatus Woesearchaeota archaeon]